MITARCSLLRAHVPVQAMGMQKSWLQSHDTIIVLENPKQTDTRHVPSGRPLYRKESVATRLVPLLHAFDSPIICPKWAKQSAVPLKARLHLQDHHCTGRSEIS